VEKEFAISVYGGLQATIDPYLYNINVTLRPGHKPEQVLGVIDNEINRLQQSLIPQIEIDRAVKQARALFAYGSENITNQAFWLGYPEMFDHYEWFEQYVEKLNQVTPQKIQTALQEYLQPQKRVVGIYLPEEVAA
jgi:zinc protease